MAKASSFSLRFHDDLTLPLLRLIAKEREMSINALIEGMVERELPREVSLLEGDLTQTLEALQAYKGKFEDDLAAFAKAEAYVEDPIRATRVETVTDPLGVDSIFA